MKHIFLSVMLIWLSSILYAQQLPVDLSKRSISSLKAAGKQSLADGDIYSALAYFKEVVKKKPSDVKTVFQVAELSRLAKNYSEAEQMYSKLISLDAESHPEAYFYLGQMQKAQGKQEDALNSFNQFSGKLSTVKDLRLRQLFSNEMAGINETDSLTNKIFKSATVEPLPTGINKAHFEGNPILIDDNTMMFLSERDVSSVYKEKKGDESAAELFPKRQLYIANKSGDTWELDGLVDNIPVNGKQEVSSGAYSYDRKRFYYTQCNDDWKGKTSCKLFVSKASGGTWSEGVLIDSDINKEGSNTTMPALGLDKEDGQEVLYFTSDRVGGSGGYDIWYAIYDKKNDRYSPASNLGRDINTIGDEVTPWYDDDNKQLYFSSNGWPTIGGFDVFTVQGQAGSFSGNVSNIGGHINSSYDELYYVHSQNDTEKGLIASNRPGTQALLSETCCYDIYEFDVTDECNKILAGKVVDEESGACITDYTLEFYVLNEETKQYDVLETLEGVEGCEFRFEDLDCKRSYKAFVKRPEYEASEVPIVFADTEGNPITGEAGPGETPDGEPYDVFVKVPLKKLPPVIVAEVPPPPPPPAFTPEVGKLYELKDVYFDYDQWDLKQRSIEVIDDILVKFMQDNPYAVVELIAHTDSRGGDAYNMVLSQKRAKVVREYMVSKGIESNRMLFYGRGERAPRTTNDTDEGRSFNRRTEFRVLGGVGNQEVNYSSEK